PLQELDQEVGDVDLPPEEPLVRRARIIVVVVVPALAQSDQGQNEVVATLVVGPVATTPDPMPQRIEGERGVIAEDRADEESPDQSGRSGDEVTRRGQREAGSPVVAVEPAEFSEATQVPDRFTVHRRVDRGE